jgi:hypothetical protein
VIDGRGLLGNALWILGLAVALSAISLAYWQARLQAQPLHRVLARRAFRSALAAGMLLFSLGLLMLESRLWARLLWGLLAALWLWQGCLAALRSHRSPPGGSRGTECDDESIR